MCGGDGEEWSEMCDRVNSDLFTVHSSPFTCSIQPPWYRLGTWSAIIENIIHPQRKPSENKRISDPEADKIMQQIIGMGIRAHAHATTTIGSGNAPVMKALFGVDLPAFYPIYYFPVIKGDGLARTDNCTLFANPAEVPDS